MNIFLFSKKFFILLILLFSLLFFQSFNKNNQQDPITKGSYLIFSKIQTTGINLQRAISNTVKKYFFLLKLRGANAQLQEENQKLKAKLQIFEEILSENKRLKKLNLFPLNKPYKLLPAQITATDFLSKNELLTINRGYFHGVKKFMGVLHPTGVVGYIFRVSSHSSQVLSLLSPLSSVPARNQRSRVQGLVEAYENNLFLFNYLNKQSHFKNQDLKLGDQIVVNKSDQLPPGFLIGEVVSLNNSSKNFNFTASIQPAVNFNSLEEVLVVLSLQKDNLNTEEIKKAMNSKNKPLSWLFFLSFFVLALLFQISFGYSGAKQSLMPYITLPVLTFFFLYHKPLNSIVLSLFMGFLASAFYSLSAPWLMFLF